MRFGIGVALIGVWLPVFSTACIAEEVRGSGIDDYLDLPLEELLTLEVSSVSKRLESLASAAAAVYVLTNEDIRRSGATSLPEVLRLVPGLHVAYINASKWSVSARGFGGQFANKLLVLIDGRTVYTPSYSGVYWDVQDTLLEDIERIEVIRGPGATLWGANAVNGIINVITKPAMETTGPLASLGAGTEDKGLVGLRYGATLGPEAYGRLYVKASSRDDFTDLRTGEDADDAWESLQGGFRLDGNWSGRDQWTLQGDLYRVDGDLYFNSYLIPTPPYSAPQDDRYDATGWNLTARWSRAWSDRSTTTLQLYYDYAERDELLLGQQQDTIDLDFQHDWQTGRHHIVWGLGYRWLREQYDNTFQVSVHPSRDETSLVSGFLQDEIELLPDRLRVILGSKIEHNDFTGFEVQPSARFVWTPDDRHSLWGAVSRAVRTPSRIEDGGRMVTAVIPTGPPPSPPMTMAVYGSSDFDSEELIAYELGYRTRAADNLTIDLSLFYNDYDSLYSNESFGRPIPNIVFDNLIEGSTLGGELVLDWRPTEWWRIRTGYSYIDGSFKRKSSSNDRFNARVAEGSVPRHQLLVHSATDLTPQWALDVELRYIDEVPYPDIPSVRDGFEIDAYFGLNARLAWQATEALELALVGRNLLDDHHLEYAPGTFLRATEVDRSLLLQLRWED